MFNTSFLPRGVWNIRLVLVCLLALSVSLPIAWISLSKVMFVVAGLSYICKSYLYGQRDRSLHMLWTPRLVLVIVIAFTASLLWTDADMQSALQALGKHIKLLETVLMVVLVRSLVEARIAMAAYALGQSFLLLSSWALFAGIPIPWQTTSTGRYEVFSTYLDQSLMFATSAGVFWHLRNQHIWSRWIGAGLATLALVNTLLLLQGRSGYLVALTTIALTAMWAMPQRLRLATLLVTPALLSVGLYLGSGQVHDRVSKIMHETQNFSQVQQISNTESSSGWRLNAWWRSLQAVKENPLHGYGVGSWTPTIKRIQGNHADDIFGQGNQSNPHQEYLLWAVEIGIGGAVLLLALFICIARDSMLFPSPIQHAAISVLAATAVACLFNSALYDDLLGDFFCVSLGLLLAMGARSLPAPYPITNTA